MQTDFPYKGSLELFSKEAFIKGFKSALNTCSAEGLPKSEVESLLQTILSSQYECFKGALRNSVVPVKAVTTAFNEYFGIKEKEPEF